MKKITMFVFVVSVLLPSWAFSTAVLLDDVPAYNQGSYPWCTFVSEASVFGYWDNHGYSNLLSAEGSAIKYTYNVWSDVLNMVDISKAGYGMVKETVVNFAQSKGYEFQTTEYYHHPDPQYPAYFVTVWNSSGMVSQTNPVILTASPFTFDMIKKEIDVGRPVLYATNGYTDPDFSAHMMPLFGYEKREDGIYLALYTNWYEAENIYWKKFDASMISSLIIVEPLSNGTSNPVSTPEPGTFSFLFLSLASLLGFMKIKMDNQVIEERGNSKEIIKLDNS